MHIALEEISKDPAALHNTSHEKQQRKTMLEGGRPDECSYCWSIEDLYKTSDRVYKNTDTINNLFVLEDEIEINGSIKTAQQLADLMALSSIDIEELVSQYTGDIIAHQLGNDCVVLLLVNGLGLAEQLAADLESAHQALFNLRFQSATRQLADASQVGKAKRRVARPVRPNRSGGPNSRRFVRHGARRIHVYRSALLSRCGIC